MFLLLLIIAELIQWLSFQMHLFSSKLCWSQKEPMVKMPSFTTRNTKRSALSGVKLRRTMKGSSSYSWQWQGTLQPKMSPRSILQMMIRSKVVLNCQSVTENERTLKWTHWCVIQMRYMTQRGEEEQAATDQNVMRHEWFRDADTCVAPCFQASWHFCILWTSIPQRTMKT